MGEGLARLVGRGEALAVEAAVGLAEEAVEQGEVARVAGHLLDERGQPAERHQRPQPAEEEELPAVVAGRGPGGPAGAAETAHQPGHEEDGRERRRGADVGLGDERPGHQGAGERRPRARRPGGREDHEEHDRQQDRPRSPGVPQSLRADGVEVEDHHERGAEGEAGPAPPRRDRDDRRRRRADEHQAAHGERVGLVAEQPVHRREQVVVGGAEVGDAEAVHRAEELAEVLGVDHRLLDEGGVPAEHEGGVPGDRDRGRDPEREQHREDCQERRPRPHPSGEPDPVLVAAGVRRGLEGQGRHRRRPRSHGADHRPQARERLTRSLDVRTTDPAFTTGTRERRPR